MNCFKKCEDFFFLAYSVSIDVSIDVKVIVQFLFLFQVSLRAFTAGSYGGKLAVISSSEILARYRKYDVLCVCVCVGGGGCGGQNDVFY